MYAYTQNNKQIYTLRPFGAGQLTDTACDDLLDFTFNTQQVTATILTATQKPHIDRVLAYLHQRTQYTG